MLAPAAGPRATGHGWKRSATTSQARIAEAKREGWLGEVEGLQVSLAGAKDKLAQIDATLQQKAATTELGMPAFTSISGRILPLDN